MARTFFERISTGPQHQALKTLSYPLARRGYLVIGVDLIFKESEITVPIYPGYLVEQLRYPKNRGNAE